jgi:hypothetical protein
VRESEKDGKKVKNERKSKEIEKKRTIFSVAQKQRSFFRFLKYFLI